MENDQEQSAKISTLVFMDLETTGLPSDVGKKNVHITEMTFVAFDRNTFEGDKSLRVVNKLSLCIRPRSVVSPGAMNITGLYNDTLENQKEFNDSIPKLLEYFFQRLQMPICLLAHNGNKFDFPVLQAELKHINYSFCSDILCADTLKAFHSICNSSKTANDPKLQDVPKEVMHSEQILHTSEKAKMKDMHCQQTQICKSYPISEDDIDNLLSQDLEVFAHMEETITDKMLLKLENSPTTNNKHIDKTLPKIQNEFLDSAQNEKTPNHKIALNEAPPVIRKRKVHDSNYTSQKVFKKEMQSVKRTLFSEPYHQTSKITKFSLENLYYHYFNEKPPKSHYAEADCISLSKICQKLNKDFLPWIDENSVSFCDIVALW